MKKSLTKLFKRRKKTYRAPGSPLRRAWGLAARLEHRRIKGKQKRK